MNIAINNKTITTPDTWNDCTLHQQLTIYGTLFAPKSPLGEDIELPAKRISIAMYLADIENDFMDAWQADCIQTHGEEEGPDVFFSEVEQFCTITDFLFDIEETPGEDDQPPIQVYSVALSLTKNPYPMLMTSDRTYKLYGPADACENITIYELGVAFTYFEAYMKTKDVNIAIELLAILWRPAKRKSGKNKRRNYEGDRRLPYMKHETTVAGRKPVMAALPEHVTQLLLFWFASCRQHIIESHPDIFKAPTGEESEGGADYGNLLLEIAGGVAKLDKVARQPYLNVFAWLSKLERERIHRVMNRR